MLLAIHSCVIIILIISYRLYSSYIAKKLALHPEFITPAHELRDDNNFVPTKPFYLFAQHFSAIAAAGPIAGPIMACILWGWLPALMWIALGVVFIGAVHDFSALAASVRHKASSLAHITTIYMGKKAGLTLIAFMWLTLLYVIIAFTDITASSFGGISEELSAQEILFNPGGAVALAAFSYLIIALIMGLCEHFFKAPLWLLTIIFVPLSFASVWLGTNYSNLLLFNSKIWCIIIIIYCVISSLMPVWLLLQPRGYLGGFFLYTTIIIGVIGIFFGNFEIKQEAFKGFNSSAGTLFPFLFVTIACGACSGFHGLVCSGTTAKQIDKESHVRPIGYGAMLGEAFIALIALATIMIFSSQEITNLKPGAIYGKGLGEFISIIIGKKYLSLTITFGAMAFSTFVFDTLDIASRLGRYLLQELCDWHNKIGAFLATIFTALVPLLLLVLAKDGSYIYFWTLFGAANQLLAALSLLAITMWLYHARMRIAFTLIPMLFVLTITLWALVDLAWTNWHKSTSIDIFLINSMVSIILIILALYLVTRALVKVRLTLMAFSKL
jgi:carbon starvation protein